MRLVQWLNKGLASVASSGEVLGAVVVLGIVFIFIVPLPTWLVDVLIAVNICFACLLIVLAFICQALWHFLHFLPFCCSPRCFVWRYRLPRLG